jgi:2'-5' RNA ligase
MRLFIGAFVQSTEILEKYHQFQDLTKDFFSGKWVEDQNLHFTFHFLGEIPNEQVPDLQNQLKDYLKDFNEKLIIKSVDGFPNIFKPRQLVGKIFSPSKEIYKLHSDIGKLLTQNNINYDKRNYRPHLTLIRIKTLADNYQDKLDSFRFYDFGEMESYKVNLIQSTLTPTGPIYKIL